MKFKAGDRVIAQGVVDSVSETDRAYAVNFGDYDLTWVEEDKLEFDDSTPPVGTVMRSGNNLFIRLENGWAMTGSADLFTWEAVRETNPTIVGEIK